MSIKVMTWVWDHSQARNGARLVLLAIADAASDDGTNAWPSVATLQRKAKLKSDRSVQAAIKELEALGELKVYPNAGPKGVNKYTVLMRPTPAEFAPPQDLPPAEFAGVENGTESDITAQDPPQNLPPAKSAPPQFSTDTPANIAGEPSLNRPTSSQKTSSSSKRGPAPKATRIPDDFAMTPEMIAWGRENFPHLDGDAITAEFVDYWRGVPGAKGTKTDWIATWRNQVRRVAERTAQPPVQHGRPSGPRRATTDERMEQADAALAEVKRMMQGNAA